MMAGLSLAAAAWSAGDVVNREEGVVGLAEADLGPLKLLSMKLWTLR